MSLVLDFADYPGVQGRLNCGRNPIMRIFVWFPSLALE
ncbi:hypothetical protein O53_4469 [Microcystis aeruginosa TAIHU98]|uniref:Uncharacterized protein n=1 Tax=Microcystis aeruginosa TAIHU98 TaxID=1134457 RepID=L7E259_MICAE|nr:hypothetical protein O53_4469 [Microcystis aeruginosa TAIHU98]ODV36410.1 hypothetical protein BFG60_4114 [Microcystis aeruginosa NIES-98]